VTGTIRTIGGDLPADLAGPVYAHEHLIIDSPLVADTMPHIHLPSVDEAVAEVSTCVAGGVRTMVDAMPAASGRSPERLSRISILTGMRIVATTGLHTDKYYGDVPWAGTESPKQLAARFIADIEDGMDTHDYRGERVERTSLRAGIVKVASLHEEPTDRDRRLFEAAAITAAVTGVPVLTHTEGGLGGMRQVEVLTDLGVPPDRIALSHTDKVDDVGYHRSLLETSVFLCYDQGIRDTERTFSLIESMVTEGFGSQIVLGTDGARRTLWATLGGRPGLAALYDRARQRLATDLLTGLFVTNPTRYLSLDQAR
jgi:predicted metal-dependent phosphotriesterase family hydrolase